MGCIEKDIPPRNLTPEIIKQIKRIREVTFGIGISFVIIAVGFFTASVTLDSPIKRIRMIWDTKTVDGHVTAVTKMREYDSEDRPGPEWRIYFAFNDSDGKEYYGKTSISNKSDIEKFSAGSKIQVCYLPDDPSYNYPPSIEPVIIYPILYLFFNLFFIIGLIILYKYRSFVSAKKNIYNEGVATEARILFLKVIWYQWGQYLFYGCKYPHNVYFSFEDGSGAVHNGVQQVYFEITQEMMESGKPTVYFDKAEPGNYLLIL